MPDPKKKTNLDEGSMGDETFGPLTSPRGARAAHQRLFGKGAKVSPYEGRIHATPDEKAWAQRPRAADRGKDINLPASPKKKSAPAKPASLSKKR